MKPCLRHTDLERKGQFSSSNLLYVVVNYQPNGRTYVDVNEMDLNKFEE